MAPAYYTLIWPFYFRLAVWFLSLAIEHRALAARIWEQVVAAMPPPQ